jgi:phosphocarrier protein FPr/phosphocarrier protein
MGLDGNSTTVFAPFSGILRSLDSLPDPAFAARMLGEGIAIDPLDDVVKAPFDGTVAAIAATGHSITLRSRQGIEVLIHVGIDTVSLRHSGFRVCVVEGQDVCLGDDVLHIDLDLIANRARDCVSPIIVLSDQATVQCLRENGVVAAGEAILLVVADNDRSRPDETQTATVTPVAIAVSLPHGIHARPAGRIAEFARSQDAAITLSFDGQSASASSVTDMLRLGVGSKDAVEVRIAGTGAAATARLLSELITDMAQQETGEVTPKSEILLPPPLLSELTASQRPGVRASPGIGIGPAQRLTMPDLDVPAIGKDCAVEAARLHHGIAQVRAQIEANINHAAPIAQQIARVHIALLEDTALIADAERRIANGASAAAAWRIASRQQESALLAAANLRLQERAADLRDVERRLIHTLMGQPLPDAAATLARGAVLICDDLDPSLLIRNPQIELAAICCAAGGPTSHAAILAAAAGIPMLVSLGSQILEIKNGQLVIADADGGLLDLAPSPEAIAQARDRLAANTGARSTALASATADCRLADGSRIEVFANLASAGDADIAVQHGAEGCGLLRTEFLFADRASAPSEKEQIAAFRAVAQALGDRPCIIRLLDVGADKPLAYFPFDSEENPALGLRGVRFLMQEQAFLRTQLRAMVAGVPLAQLRIMLPMVVDLAEFRMVRAVLAEVLCELGLAVDVPLGIMIETPAAAMLSDQLAAEADFLSIGTNDLSQYVLAMDRGNAALASRVDACHPAVLRVIAQTATGAARHQCWLGVCGGLASEPDAAPLLVGLGCQELSAVPRAVPAIKQVLGLWSMQQCRMLAKQAMQMSSAGDIRQLLIEARK